MLSQGKFLAFAPGEALEELQRRDGPYPTPDKHLGRYFTAVADARAKLGANFTREEKCLLLDIGNGSIFPSTAYDIATYMLFEVKDAIGLDHQDVRWGVDAETILTKLQGLDLISNIALIDAIEQWWKLIGEGHQPDPGNLFSA